MRRFATGLGTAIIMSWAAWASAQETVAITEFMSDPVGEFDGGREWIELYNYGTQPVNIANWTIADQGNDVMSLPNATIAPSDYVIIVPSPNRFRTESESKAFFEMEWLGGKPDPRVFGASGRFSLGNGADQIILNNAARRPVMAIAYRGDGVEGRATFLFTEDFRVRLYGTDRSPGINRKGPDNVRAAAGFLGYESNDATPDPMAYESDVSKLEEEWGPDYKTPENGGDAKPCIGSPLKGHYTGGK